MDTSKNKNQPHQNVGDIERVATGLIGAALGAWGIYELVKRRDLKGISAGVSSLATGGSLLYRAQSGHCPIYSLFGFNTKSIGQLAKLGQRFFGKSEDAKKAESSERYSPSTGSRASDDLSGMTPTI